MKIIMFVEIEKYGNSIFDKYSEYQLFFMHTVLTSMRVNKNHVLLLKLKWIGCHGDYLTVTGAPEGYQPTHFQ